nr:MAG TPA_asm: hypothetical protein [Caudoviricetes sp.]
MVIILDSVLIVICITSWAVALCLITGILYHDVYTKDSGEMHKV